jgi:hypothetical protein
MTDMTKLTKLTKLTKRGSLQNPSDRLSWINTISTLYFDVRAARWKKLLKDEVTFLWNGVAVGQKGGCFVLFLAVEVLRAAPIHLRKVHKDLQLNVRGFGSTLNA